MRRRRGSTKYSRRERDFPRMGWIKTLPCVLADGVVAVAGDLWIGPHPDTCRRAVEAHHAGEHGLGEKPDDDTCIPLCDHHHDSLTDRRGVFSGWQKYGLKIWELAVVAHYQAMYAARSSSGDVGDPTW
jgi:hypothetical protein